MAEHYPPSFKATMFHSQTQIKQTITATVRLIEPRQVEFFENSYLDCFFWKRKLLYHQTFSLEFFRQSP